MVYLFRSILKQHTGKSYLRLSKINAVHKVCIYGIFVQVNFEATHWKIISKALKNKCCAQGVYIWYICSGQF